MGRALVCGFGALAPDTLALCLAAILLLVLTRLRVGRHRSQERVRHLRRIGAQPGSWIWAIDAEAARCTARIRAGMDAVADQARRTPSMRIQSPSCSQRKLSNQAA